MEIIGCAKKNEQFFIRLLLQRDSNVWLKVKINQIMNFRDKKYSPALPAITTYTKRLTMKAQTQR